MDLEVNPELQFTLRGGASAEGVCPFDNRSKQIRRIIQVDIEMTSSQDVEVIEHVRRLKAYRSL